VCKFSIQKVKDQSWDYAAVERTYCRITCRHRVDDIFWFNMRRAGKYTTQVFWSVDVTWAAFVADRWRTSWDRRRRTDDFSVSVAPTGEWTATYAGYRRQYCYCVAGLIASPVTATSLWVVVEVCRGWVARAGDQ